MSIADSAYIVKIWSSFGYLAASASIASANAASSNARSAFGSYEKRQARAAIKSRLGAGDLGASPCACCSAASAGASASGAIGT